MSVLTIAQNVANETGFLSPTSLVGNADETAILLLALITAEINDLSVSIIFGQANPIDFRWQYLIKNYNFNFVANQQNYALPSDFANFIPKSIWNSTYRRPLLAPINAEDYGIQQYYLITSGIDKMVYVYGNQMYVTPTPGSTDSIFFQYTTNNFFKSSGGTPQTSILADTDTCYVPENIVKLGVKIRFLTQKGIIPAESFQASPEYINYSAAAQKAMLIDGLGQKNPITMSRGGSAYWKAAYTQDSNFPTV